MPSSYDYSNVTPYLANVGEFDVFHSLYKDLRYQVQIAKYITVDSKYEANLPGLAFDMYGDVSLWRAILYANGLADPINDIVVGCRLAIPEIGSLMAYLTRPAAQQATVVI